MSERTLERLGEAARAARDAGEHWTAEVCEEAAARLRQTEDALRNVSVHSAHLPSAPRELLVQLLARCGDIASAALTAPHDSAVSDTPE